MAVIELSEHTLPLVMTLGRPEKLLFQFILWLNLIVGGFYRVLVLKLIQKQGFRGRPMNLFIAFDEVVRMAGYSSWIILQLMVVQFKSL